MAQTSIIGFLPAIPHGEDFAEFKYSLPSVVAIVSEVIDRLVSRICTLRIPDGSEEDIELALREALCNAVIHGNGEDPFKRVLITLHSSADGEVEITVRDEGTGFDVDSVPDPTAPSHLLSNHGRGIFLMRTLMDEVLFEEGGTVVRMRKRSPCPATLALKRQGYQSLNEPESLGTPGKKAGK